MILMNSMPDSYHPVKNAFQHAGVLPSYDVMCVVMRTRQNEKKIEKNKNNCPLIARNRTKGQNNKGKPSGNNTNAARGKNDQLKDNKGKRENRKCYFCGKNDHLNQNCFK